MRALALPSLIALAMSVGPARAEDDRFARARERMVADQLAARGIEDARVLSAMRSVPRHEFVPAERRDDAYEDYPIGIGHGQTISQPYIVALMTSLARIGPGDRVLEVGTGSGYQAAVLAACGAEVWTIEIVAPLAERARRDLARLGFERVHVRSGDGYRGWPEVAPFDAIVVTAAPPGVPAPLFEQLALGGRLVVPVGASGAVQSLEVHTKTERGIEIDHVAAVRFVPMTGEAQKNP